MQNLFVLIEQKLTTEVIQWKNALFDTLKSLNIKFINNPIKELTFIGLNRFMSKIYIPPVLSEDNIKIYKSLKVYSKMGYYNGLELSKIEENVFVIGTTQDIKENTLLFKIGGEYYN